LAQQPNHEFLVWVSQAGKRARDVGRKGVGYSKSNQKAEDRLTFPKEAKHARVIPAESAEDEGGQQHRQ
jgi:hypothetical protein